MQAKYTITLKDYIDIFWNKEIETEEEKLFRLFPNIEYSQNETQFFNFNFKDMFIKKYLYREIGQETAQLFTHFLNNKLHEIIVEYVPKINIYKENFSKLMERVMPVKTYGSNTYYMNPMVEDNNEIKIQDKDAYENTTEKMFTYFKSNPDILKQVLELENIYLTALNRFENLFMGVL